jgi:uncharacterized membrane protein
MKPKDRKAILADPKNHHPASVIRAKKHQDELQYRIADAVTTFVGSMYFIYIHVAVILFWLVVEPHPWHILTTALSVEAILLVSFVMIGQNRATRFAQVKADQDFALQNKELHHNTELLEALSNKMDILIARGAASGPNPFSSRVASSSPEDRSPDSVLRQGGNVYRGSH